MKSPEKQSMTVEQAMTEIRTRAVVDLWPTVGTVLGLSRSSVYDAANRGEIDMSNLAGSKRPSQRRCARSWAWRPHNRRPPAPARAARPDLFPEITDPDQGNQ